MQDSYDVKSTSVPSRLPWILAAAALVLYGLTLHHWVSLASLPLVAKVAGWDWTLPHQAPLFFVVTFPLRWLPAAVQPIVLNAFSAVCAALTLALLARSVLLLPQDRTHQQRQRERSEFSLLSNRTAWLPPVVAVLVCGLQLTFWEHASVVTGEMLDLLLFAYVIRCLLEFRVEQRGAWLSKFAFVYGLGVTNNWAMIGFFPAFLVALIWIRGLSFLQPAFMLRTLGWGLAGLSLYLLLPLVWQFSGESEFTFWEILRANVGQQKAYLFNVPALRSRALLLSLTSLLPVFLMGIRWPTTSGETSAAGTMLTNLMFRVIHVALLAVCLWVAFDQKFSPRALGFGLPFLTFYYLGALSIGYFIGYLLLVFSERGRSRRQPSGSTPLLGAAMVTLMWIAALGVPAALAYKNWKLVRQTNAPSLRPLAAAFAAGLPAPTALVLSDDPYALLLLRGHLSGQGEGHEHVLVHTRSLSVAGYHRQLSKRYPRHWPSTLASGDEAFDDGTLLRLLTDLARTNTVYYLHPSFGYYFERFYPRPNGLVSEMMMYPTNFPGRVPLTAESIATNQAFWTQQEDFLKTLGTLPNSKDAPYVRRFLSRSLNTWGVALQRSGKMEEATKHFQSATELNTNNLAAYVNLEFNRARRSGQTQSTVNFKQIEDRFGAMRASDALEEGGPFDEPNYCLGLGDVFAQTGLYGQALIEFQRARELQPDLLATDMAVARVYLEAGRPAESISHLRNLRDRSQTPLGEPVIIEAVRLEASAEYMRTNVASAQKLLLDAHAKYPKNPGLLDSLVHLYTQERRYSDALETLNQLEALAPENPQVPINRATVHFNSKAYDKALATLDQMLAKNPKDIPAQLYKVFVLVQTREYQKALPIVENVLRADPVNVEALNFKGVLAIESQDYAEAIPVLERVLKARPNDWNALRNRAIAYLKMSKLREARADYVRLLQLVPRYYVAYYGLGEIAYREKKRDEAIKQYERYLKYFPTDAASLLDQEKNQVAERLKELQAAQR